MKKRSTVFRAGVRSFWADGWTIATEDQSLFAHYEHTVVVRKRKPILLTAA